MEVMVVEDEPYAVYLPVPCEQCRHEALILQGNGDVVCHWCSWHMTGSTLLTSRYMFKVNLPTTWQVCWLL